MLSLLDLPREALDLAILNDYNPAKIIILPSEPPHPFNHRIFQS